MDTTFNLHSGHINITNYGWHIWKISGSSVQKIFWCIVGPMRMRKRIQAEDLPEPLPPSCSCSKRSHIHDKSKWKVFVCILGFKYGKSCLIERRSQLRGTVTSCTTVIPGRRPQRMTELQRKSTRSHRTPMLIANCCLITCLGKEIKTENIDGSRTGLARWMQNRQKETTYKFRTSHPEALVIWRNHLDEYT